MGETAEEGTLLHSCEEVEGAPGRVRYRVQAVKCTHNGTIHDEGETWASEHLKYLCKVPPFSLPGSAKSKSRRRRE